MSTEIEQLAPPRRPYGLERGYFGRRAMFVLIMILSSTLVLTLSSLALEQERQVNLVYLSAAIDEMYSEKGPYNESAVCDYITILKEFGERPEYRTLSFLGRFVQLIDFQMRIKPIIKILGESTDPEVGIDLARNQLYDYYSDVRRQCMPKQWDELPRNDEFCQKTKEVTNEFSRFVEELPPKIDADQCVDACKKSRYAFMVSVRSYARSKINDEDREVLERFFATERNVERKTFALLNSGSLAAADKIRVAGYRASMLRRISIIELLRDGKTEEAVAAINYHLDHERKNPPPDQGRTTD